MPTGLAAANSPVAPAGPMEPERRIEAGCTPSSDHPDARWLDEARCEFDLVARLMCSPETLPQLPLLRSRTFNPRDLWLEAEQRDEVDRLRRDAVEPARLLVDRLRDVEEREFAVAQAAGESVVIDLERVNGALALLPAGLEPFYRVIDGVTHAVPSAKMPLADAARQRVRQAGCDVVRRLARVFHSLGTLTESEMTRIVDRAAARARGIQTG